MPNERKAELVDDNAGEVAAGMELIRRGEALTAQAVRELDPVLLMASLVQEGQLLLRMEKPPDWALTKLKDDTKFVEDAQAYSIESTDDFKVADQRQTALHDEYEELEVVRTDGNAGLLGMKNAWDMLFSSGVKARKSAVAILQGKMRTYETEQRANAAIGRVNADSILAGESEKTQLEIAQLRERASKAKGAKKAELTNEANRLERIARLTPTEVAEPRTSVPETGGSGRGRPWTGAVEDSVLFMCWLLGIPKDVVEALDRERVSEWFAGVEYKPAMLNALAKLVTDSRKVPGFKASQQTSYRRDPRRK